VRPFTANFLFPGREARLLYCKNGRLHPLRRCHKRYRSFPRGAAVPAFYPIRAWVDALPELRVP